MSQFIVENTELISIADAIRAKGGTSAGLTFPAGFVSAIENIPAGGGTIKSVTGSIPSGSDQTFTGSIPITPTPTSARSIFGVSLMTNTSQFSTQTGSSNASFIGTIGLVPFTTFNEQDKYASVSTNIRMLYPNSISGSSVTITISQTGATIKYYYQTGQLSVTLNAACRRRTTISARIVYL